MESLTIICSIAQLVSRNLHFCRFCRSDPSPWIGEINTFVKFTMNYGWKQACPLTICQLLKRIDTSCLSWFYLLPWVLELTHFHLYTHVLYLSYNLGPILFVSCISIFFPFATLEHSLSIIFLLFFMARIFHSIYRRIIPQDRCTSHTHIGQTNQERGIEHKILERKTKAYAKDPTPSWV